MQDRMSTRRARWGVALAALALAALPAAARADYTAPPPEPGFHYIFDGTAAGSDASFDKWIAANGATEMTLDQVAPPVTATGAWCSIIAPTGASRQYLTSTYTCLATQALGVARSRPISSHRCWRPSRCTPPQSRSTTSP